MRTEKKERRLRQKGHDGRELSYERRDHSTCNHDANMDIPKRHMEMSEVVIYEFLWK